MRSVLVLCLTAPLAACAVDTEGDLDEDSDLEDTAEDTVEDVQGWEPLELEGVPSGAVMTKQVAAAGFPCPRDFACMFNGHDGGGTVVGVRSGFGLPDLRQLEFNDKASSWRNRAGRRYCWYRDINFTGPEHGMPAGRQRNITGTPNNEASSYRPCN